MSVYMRGQTVEADKKRRAIILASLPHYYDLNDPEVEGRTLSSDKRA